MLLNKTTGCLCGGLGAKGSIWSVRDFSFEPSEQGACGQRAHEAGEMKSCCSLKDECRHGGTQKQGAWDTGRKGMKWEKMERVDCLV